MEASPPPPDDESNRGGGGGGDGTTAVRRPMNAFLIFCKRHRTLVREKHPHLDNRSVTRILGELWANLPADEKSTYTNLAKQYKDAFMKANPDYKWYNPEKTRPPSPQTTVDTKKPLDNVLKFEDQGINPGKLADPNNMGSGLSLLLMASNLEAERRQQEAPPPAVPEYKRKTVSSLLQLAEKHKEQKPVSSLQQLAEMCSSRIETSTEAKPSIDIKPAIPSSSVAAAPATSSSVAMTPPWTPKYEPHFSPKAEPTSSESEEPLPKYKKAMKTHNQQKAKAQGAKTQKGNKSQKTSPNSEYKWSDLPKVSMGSYSKNKFISQLMMEDSNKTKLGSQHMPASSTSHSKPSNQIQDNNAPNGNLVFKTKAALKSPPPGLSKMGAVEVPLNVGGVTAPAAETPKKIFSIVATTAAHVLSSASLTNQQAAYIQALPLAAPPHIQVPPPPPQNSNRQLMDNVIETMYVHEMGTQLKQPMVPVGLAVNPVTVSNTININVDDIKQAKPVAQQPPNSMTYGQIQETLIRKAINLGGNSTKSESTIEKFPKIETEIKTEKPKPELQTSFLFPFFSAMQSSAQIKTEVKAEAGTPVKTEPSGMSGGQELMRTPDRLKVKEEDLECHEQMDDDSPITREEMEKKLLSNSAELAAASSSHSNSGAGATPASHLAQQPSSAVGAGGVMPLKKRRKVNLSSSMEDIHNYGQKLGGIEAIMDSIIGEEQQSSKQKSSKKKSTPQGTTNIKDLYMKMQKRSQSSSNIKTNAEEEKPSPKLQWQRHSSYSDNSNNQADASEEENSREEGVRKSSRRNRGKRYQELISQGLIQSARGLKQQRLSEGSHSDDTLDKDFHPSSGAVFAPSLPPPPTTYTTLTTATAVVPASATRKRKRTVSENSLPGGEADAVRYKTGDFDLDEKIKSLPAVTIENVTNSRGKIVRRSSSSTNSGQRPSGAGSGIHPKHTYKKTASTSQNLSMGQRGLMAKQSPSSATSFTSSLSTTSESVAPPTVSAPPVTGSAKRKVRRKAITRLVVMPGVPGSSSLVKLPSSEASPSLTPVSHPISVSTATTTTMTNTDQTSPSMSEAGSEKENKDYSKNDSNVVSSMDATQHPTDSVEVMQKAKDRCLSQSNKDSALHSHPTFKEKDNEGLCLDTGKAPCDESPLIAEKCGNSSSCDLVGRVDVNSNKSDELAVSSASSSSSSDPPAVTECDLNTLANLALKSSLPETISSQGTLQSSVEVPS